MNRTVMFAEIFRTLQNEAARLIVVVYALNAIDMH